MGDEVLVVLLASAGDADALPRRAPLGERGRDLGGGDDSSGVVASGSDVGSDGSGDEVPGLRLVVVGSPSLSVESLDRASFSEEGSSRLRCFARRKIPTAALGLKKNLGGTSASSTSAKDEDAPPPLGHSEVTAIQHSPGEVVKPDFAEDRADHRELGAVVLGKEAPGLVATATRTAPLRASSSLPSCIIASVGQVFKTVEVKSQSAIVSSGISANETPSEAMES